MKEEIFKRLDAIGEKLGVAAQHLYAVYVRQSVVEGYVNMISTALALAVFVVALLLFRRGIKTALVESAYGDKYPDSAITFMMIGGFLMLMSFCFVCGYFVYGIEYLMNPEYWALHHLFEDLRGK